MISGTGYSLGAGIAGSGFTGLNGSGSFAGAYGSSSGANSYGVYGTDSAGFGVYGARPNAGTINLCSGGVLLFCSGGAFAGDNGVIGQSDTSNGVGVIGVTTQADGFGLLSKGAAVIEGDLTVTGAKTGYVADYAINGSKVTLHQGDAVTLLGVKAAAIGNIPLLVVGPAKSGDTVIGVVDREMTPTAATFSVPGSVLDRHPAGRIKEDGSDSRHARSTSRSRYSRRAARQSPPESTSSS